MAINATLKSKASIADREARYASRMKHLSQPKREGLYDVVEGTTIIARAVPLEHITSYGVGMFNVKMVPTSGVTCG